MRQRLSHHLLNQNPINLFTRQNLLQIQTQLTISGLLHSDPSQPTNASTWPIMVRRLNLAADPLRVFSVFKAMQSLKHPVRDPFVFASLIKACNKVSAIREGKSIHCHVVRLGLDYNVNLWNSVLSLYSCAKSLVGYARKVFDEMSQRTVVSVNAIVTGFVKNSMLDEGVGLFKKVLGCCDFGSELKPNYVTLVVLVSGCVELDGFSVGKALHSYGCKTGLDLVTEVCNVLIDLYSKFGCVDEAARMFDVMSERDLVSWNSMIAGYAGVGDCRKALCLFREMREGNVVVDGVSLISLIVAAANSRDLSVGKVVHGSMIAMGAEISVAIGTALIDMYSKCGSTEWAKKVLEELQDESTVPWNSMIHGYVECGHNKEALGIFNQIRSRKVRPDEGTMVGLISACRNLGDLSQGIGIHSYLEKNIHLRESMILHNALIDMYSKCGSMSRAKAVFDKMPQKDVVSWTSIIVGHAINGEGKEAILAFRKMCAEKVEPNSVTFIGVLSACDHAGLVEEGLHFYDDMSKLYHIEPQIEHCGCIIDMLARAGKLEEAHRFVKSMPIELNAVVWRMLANACRVHGDLGRGLSLVSELTDLNTFHVAEDHVVSSNILADAGRWDDVLDERMLMAARTDPKLAGKSSISDFR